jgi:hypothetical protein
MDRGELAEIMEEMLIDERSPLIKEDKGNRKS